MEIKWHKILCVLKSWSDCLFRLYRDGEGRRLPSRFFGAYFRPLRSPLSLFAYRVTIFVSWKTYDKSCIHPRTTLHPSCAYPCTHSTTIQCPSICTRPALVPYCPALVLHQSCTIPHQSRTRSIPMSTRGLQLSLCRINAGRGRHMLVETK
jgi:hypothetical protein